MKLDFGFAAFRLTTCLIAWVWADCVVITSGGIHFVGKVIEVF